MDSDLAGIDSEIGIDQRLERAERIIATGKAMLAAYEAVSSGGSSTASASINNQGMSGWVAALCAGSIVVGAVVGAIGWRDSANSEALRAAQVEAVEARWDADVKVRDAEASARAAQRTAEIRILAAERRADMAELTTLRAQVQSTGDDIKGLRAYDARFASELAIIKAATNGK